ncbi:MAG: hypothetical protein KKC11_03395 [Candidatus Omnitrophica bacterium]|nr:hypothetical protein [Candidatus Omnitrophota bacterium]
MKKIIFFLFLVIPIFSYGKDKLAVTIFYSPHCKACFELKNEFLPPLEEKYKDKVEWRILNADDNPSNLKMLYALTEKFEKKKARYPSILVGNIFLSGGGEIKLRLNEAIETNLKRKTSTLPFFEVDLVKVFKNLSVFTVMGSGLIDGVNPCAFAVIVFFISFLAVYGYRKREVVYVGLFYCLAVFVTYLFIGLGLFKFLYSLAGFYLLIRFFYYFVAVFCFLLAGLALYDYFKFKKTKESEGLILQLPKFMKKRINLIIGSKLRERGERGVIGLSATAFVVGFLVSLLEAVCTGQVYLPTIVFILKNESLRLKAVTYLFLYNFMFILPLVVIFLLSLLGFNSQKFNRFLKQNLGRIKIIMAVVFFLLGAFILWLS